MAEAAGATAFTLKCLKEKRVPIGVTVVVAALLLAVIALAAKKCPSCPSCPSPTSPPCLESGIAYGEKCFYFVEEAAEWRRSQSSCLALGARLTTVDTREELRFLVRYGSPGQYWVGLRRESSGVWRWINGSLFNNLFDVRGEGQCAHTDLDGMSSAGCSQMKSSICSHLQKRPGGLQKPPETQNST
ncbi:C-type lectin domain family 2 member B-like [Podargus strigoides]